MSEKTTVGHIENIKACMDEAIDDWKIHLNVADEDFCESLDELEKKIDAKEDEENILRVLIKALDNWKLSIEAAQEVFFDVLRDAKEELEEVLSLRRLQGE